MLEVDGLNGCDGDEAKLTELGCDYITGTVRLDKPIGGLHSLATELFRNEATEGNKIRPFGMSGFKGFKCGAVEVAMREEEVMVRLSSHCAATSWKQVVALSDNVSRIDLQATVRAPFPPTSIINRHRKAATRYSDSRRRGPKVRWVAEHRGGYTLYLGSRDSNVFGRIYDKWHKSKVDQYLGCVRYEVQFQDELAKFISRQLSQVRSPLPDIAAYIQQFFSGRGVRLQMPDVSKATYCCSRQRSDDLKTLEWLVKAVRPCIKSLKSRGKLEEVLAALELDHAFPIGDSGSLDQ